MNVSEKKPLFLGIVIVIVLACLAWYLAFPAMVRSFDVLQRFSISDSKEKLNKVNKRINGLKIKINRLEQTVKPGPEPKFRWGSPLESRMNKKVWKIKKELYEKSQSELRDLKEKLESAETIKGILENQNIWSDIWYGFISPLLHLLLAWTILGLISHVIFRLLLIMKVFNYIKL